MSLRRRERARRTRLDTQDGKANSEGGRAGIHDWRAMQHQTRAGSNYAHHKFSREPQKHASLGPSSHAIPSGRVMTSTGWTREVVAGAGKIAGLLSWCGCIRVPTAKCEGKSPVGWPLCETALQGRPGATIKSPAVKRTKKLEFVCVVRSYREPH